MNQPKRYRVLGYVWSGYDEDTLTRQWISKGKTIFQCDSLDEALNQIKVISEEHPECTKFEIERGEWL